MVSLTDRQSLIALTDGDSHLKAVWCLIEGKVPVVSGDGLHARLLNSIVTGNASEFEKVVGELNRRSAQPESDWCQDDYLLFLLLLGKGKFTIDVPFFSRVMDARRSNSSAMARKLDGVLLALYRDEFSIDSDYAFLKIPFLHLIGRLRLGSIEARKAMEQLSDPTLLESLPPFLKLLALSSYELILFERRPIPTETTAQLLEGFEAHAKDLSLNGWWRVFTALPLRFIVGIVGALVVTFPVGYLLGAGKGLIDRYFAADERTRPAEVEIANVTTSTQGLPVEAGTLASSLVKPAAAGHKSVVALVSATPFAKATRPFVVEVSHPAKVVRNAIAFVRGAEFGKGGFMVVPVQRDGGRFRALLPQLNSGNAIQFAVEIELLGTEDADAMCSSLVLRPLD